VGYCKGEGRGAHAKGAILNKVKMNKTNQNVGWAAYTFNPVTGCLGPTGDGKHCDYCYAKKMTERFGQNFEPTFYPDRLDAPGNTPVPKVGNTRVFVCSMGELFGPWILDEWIEKIFEVVRANPQWTFLFLTKCPDRLPVLDWPRNAWIGATIDKQERVEAVIEAFVQLYFRRIYNNKLFVSCEPLLEHTVIPERLWNVLNWIIIGAKSEGKKKIQPKTEWIENLFTQARQYRVPVWMKDNLKFLVQEIPHD
jgi:protein gp37